MSGQVRVAFFLTSFRGGGAEKAMVRLANGLAETGVYVNVVVVEAVGPNRQLLSDKVRLTDLNRSSVSSCFIQLVSYFRQQQPDAMLSTGLHACVIASMAHFVARSRAVLIAREALPLSIEFKQKRLLRVLARLFYPRHHGMVALTQCQTADRATQLRVKSSTQQVVIPNSVDWDLLTEATRADCLPPLPTHIAEQPFIVSMGRLNQQKNFTLLLRAYASVAQQLPHNLVVLGEGQDREQLTALIAELKLELRVWLAGYTANPYPYLNRADLFVLSSKFEGMPNALIDAIAVGKPVVATDCLCGPAEVIQGVSSAKLVPVEDETAMSNAIKQQLLRYSSTPTTNPTHSAQTSTPVHIPVPEAWRERYAHDQVVAQYLELINHLCHKMSTSGRSTESAQ